ncbi:hypothetical protein PYW07_016058 [Mythimna separata]|uniref:Uncharacterized protein n=1 Tax=Mythimna separata TaxID=271217 RepID=A0AAD7YRX5_MYTSE|nr:hypothetical protein PYW07_016058 [Mythimna separata]
MEYYIPYSDVPVGSSARPWFNADCTENEKRKHSAFLAWVDARDRKAPDLSSTKRAFNHSAKSYKKALRKTRYDRISHIGQKLSAQPSGSRAVWSLAKSVEANFCRPTLPPLVRPDGTLAHTAREREQVSLHLSSPTIHFLTLAVLLHRLYLTAAPRCTRSV